MSPAQSLSINFLAFKSCFVNAVIIICSHFTTVAFVKMSIFYILLFFRCIFQILLF